MPHLHHQGAASVAPSCWPASPQAARKPATSFWLAGLAISCLLFESWACPAVAQERLTGPPACPARKQLPLNHIVKEQAGVEFHPVQPARPSAQQAQATAEQAAADPTIAVAAEPFENFGVARYRLADYGDCVGNGGCYWRDLEAQLERAEQTLKDEVALHPRRQAAPPLAIILDIDETTLSNYCEMKVEDFGYIPKLFNSWVVTPEAAVAIPGTLRLFNAARAAGVEVFFLTGRPEEQRAATARNLTAAGFHGWKGLILRDAAEKQMPTVAYKSSQRARLVAAGYVVILSVGDQWSDLAGSPKAERSVKLPNPFYYLP